LKVGYEFNRSTTNIYKNLYITFIKNLIDFCMTLVLLISAIPLFVLLAVFIKADSKGPVLYRQLRVGYHGKLFYIYKFRTMQDGLPESVSPSKSCDPRITKVGCFLRKTSLDEMPQLINVLKGEMSLVGPRPEMKWIVDRYYTGYERQRFLVKPGITGLWQLSMDRTKPIHENLQYDFEYIKNVSFLLDIKILSNTLIVLFKSNTC
jgi:undecaprenyl phosphate N,N'-diacetylbacillosamine 1-phosphate transferase